MRKIQLVPKCKMDEMRKILFEYLMELSEFDPDIKFDVSGVPIYGWFDEYWKDVRRFPFYFVVDGKVAGLALVRELKNLNYEIAEFYVLPKYRENDNAIWFATEVVKLFYGKMEISTRHTNPRAVKFWSKFVDKYVCEKHSDNVWVYWTINT